MHHSKAVKKYLEKILVFCLPSYLLELNSNEMRNANLEQHVIKAAPARNKIV